MNTIDDDDLLSRKAFGKYEDVKSNRSGRVRVSTKGESRTRAILQRDTTKVMDKGWESK